METITFLAFAIILAFVAFVHIIGKSRELGVTLGLFLVILSIFILKDGLEYKTGVFVNDSTNTVENVYTNIKTETPLLNNFIGVSLVLVGLYFVLFNSIVIARENGINV